jgi:hypothetical protein
MSSASSSFLLGLPPFPAEHILQQQPSVVDLPNWEWEILRLKMLLVVASILWLVLVPYYVLFRRGRNRIASAPKEAQSTGNSECFIYRVKGNKKPIRRSRYLHCFVVVPATVFVAVVGLLFSAILLIAVASPYNSYTSRRVFQTPLLTEAECQRIIDMAFVAAAENIKKLSRYNPEDFSDKENQMMYDEPSGWQKVRHEHYPTTDLNLVTDPFAHEDQEWIRQLCDQRLAPILSRVFGIPIRSIRAKDMFVVRYDADMTRHKLSKHTDDGDISFTIYLNHDFEGGGTQFWNRYADKPFSLLQSNSSGHLSTFYAGIEHEGYPTTKGRRMILVGFLDVVRYDEDDVSPTGLSFFASWFNINWVFRRVVDKYTDFDWETKYWRKKTARCLRWLRKIVDRYSTHSVVPPLIAQEHLPEFLNALESSYSGTVRSNKARWLEGQQKKAFIEFISDLFDDDEVDGDDDESVDEEL